MSAYGLKKIADGEYVSRDGTIEIRRSSDGWSARDTLSGRVYEHFMLIGALANVTQDRDQRRREAEAAEAAR